ncbi:MAG: DEAD/DEAH box helicase [Bdellovibrionales bacterium]
MIDASIENGEVRIKGADWEYSKLKTSVHGILGSAVRIEGRSFVFPEACLPLLRDVLPDGIGIDAHMEETVGRFASHASARNVAMEILERQGIVGVSDDWSRRLDPAQAVAVSAMILPELLGLCLFDEQGSGKTVMTIAAFDILRSRGDVDAMIVVCPKSMLSEWPKDLERFLPDKYVIETAEGSGQEKYRSALKNFDVLVTNYEGVDQMRTALSATASKRSYLLVVDESYYLKNAESLRSDAAGKLRMHCSKCFVLCGTPAPNSPHDLINQFNLADRGYTFGSFRKSKDPEEDRDEISALVEARGTFIRRLKTEILQDVPEKNFHVIKTPLSPRQALMYEKARTELELELRGLDNSMFRKKLLTYFQKRAALLQICSCPSSIDPTMSDASAKLPRLDELLSNLVGNGRKVVLWSFYKRSLDELEERYSEYGPVRIDGTVGTKARREAVRAFQEDPERMLFIGNPAAAGAGITLHASYDAVYVSYSNQAAHYMQSLDRIHRRGQRSKEVNYYLLVCENTIEETEVLRLRGKEIQQHSLLGDSIVWPGSLDEALKELSRVEV